MAEVLHDFGTVRLPDGTVYQVRACGSAMNETLWQAWLEFEPVDGGSTFRSPRETTQPNRTDTVYWATGLTPVYIEGALHRALNPIAKIEPSDVAVPAFDGPAPSGATPTPSPATAVRRRI